MRLLILLIMLLLFFLLTRSNDYETENFTPRLRTFYRPHIRNMRYYINYFHNKYYINMKHYFKKNRLW